MVAEDLRLFAEDYGWTATSWLFDSRDMLPEGATPVGGLSSNDLRSLQIPAVLLRAGANASSQVLFVTTIEGLEDSPREEGPTSRLPSPAVDLSASAAAALLAAASSADWNRTGNVSVHLLLLGGELGFRGWGGLAYFPLLRQEGYDFFDEYDAIIGIQNVGGCPVQVQPWHGAHRSVPTMSLFRTIRNLSREQNFQFNETPLRGNQMDFREFGIHRDPATRLALEAYPALLISGGWWGGRTNAGLASDDINHLCRAGLDAATRLIQTILSNLDAVVRSVATSAD